MEVDVTQEMMDLNKMYRGMLRTLNERKHVQLRTLVGYMEKFIETYNQEGEMANKLMALNEKLPAGFGSGFNDEGEEE